MGKEKEKLPLGIKPKHIVARERIEDIANAILRYSDVEKPVPIEWAEELSQLITVGTDLDFGLKDSGVEITFDEFKSFLNLLMAADPFPCEAQDREVLENFANESSIKFGYRTWIECYHFSKDSRRTVHQCKECDRTFYMFWDSIEEAYYIQQTLYGICAGCSINDKAFVLNEEDEDNEEKEKEQEIKINNLCVTVKITVDEDDNRYCGNCRYVSVGNKMCNLFGVALMPHLSKKENLSRFLRCAKCKKAV